MRITHYYNTDGDGGIGGFMGGAFDNFGAPTKLAGTPTEDAAVPPTSTPTAPVIDQAQVVQDQTTLETLMNLEPTALTAEQKTQLEALKNKYEVQEFNEDGTPISAEQKQAKAATEKRLNEIKTKPELQRTVEEVKFLNDNTEKVLNLFQQVDEVYGGSIEVDYEGVDPLSVEGVIKREEAIRELAVEQYDTELKNTYPLAYQFLLHLQNGGKPEGFLQQSTEDYQSITLAKEDKATQESIYRKALTLKGNTADQIDTLVQVARDKGKLYENSQAELINLQKAQLVEEKKREIGVAQKKQLEAKVTGDFYNKINGLVTTKVAGLVIPKTEREEFTKYMMENTYVRDGKIVYYKELNIDQVEEEMAANYFKFKKGELTGLVTRKAASNNAEQIKKRITVKLTPKGATEQKKTIVPMSQV